MRGCGEGGATLKLAMQADISAPESVARQAFYIPALDGLRVVAFLMVFFHHRIPDQIPVGGWVTGDIAQWYNGLWRALAHGVPLFFVLSAYLITTLLLVEKERTGRVRIGDFYLRRILRIWPLYFTIIVLAVLWSNWRDTVPLRLDEILRFITLNGNFGAAGGAVYPLSIVILWSVCVEEQFYLVWPWFVKTCSRKGLAYVAVALVAVGLASRVYLAVHHHPWQVFWFATQCQLDCFGYGVLLALFGARLTVSAAVRRVMFFGAFLLMVLVVRYFPTVAVDHVGIPSAVAYTLVAALAGALVALTASRGDSTKGLLASRSIAGTGKITYGLYCYHALIILIVEELPLRNLWLILVVRLLATGVVAYLSFRYLESPFLRLRRKFQPVRSGALG